MVREIFNLFIHVSAYVPVICNHGTPTLKGREKVGMTNVPWLYICNVIVVYYRVFYQKRLPKLTILKSKRLLRAVYETRREPGKDRLGPNLMYS